MDLWNDALQNLDPNEKQYYSVSQSSSQKILASILKDAQAKRDAAHEKRWKDTNSDGSKIIIETLCLEYVRQRRHIPVSHSFSTKALSRFAHLSCNIWQKRESSGLRTQSKGWPRQCSSIWKPNTMLCNQL